MAEMKFFWANFRCLVYLVTSTLSGWSIVDDTSSMHLVEIEQTPTSKVIMCPVAKLVA